MISSKARYRRGPFGPSFSQEFLRADRGADLRWLQRTRFVRRRGHIEPPARARLGSAYPRADALRAFDERPDDRAPATARLRGKGSCGERQSAVKVTRVLTRDDRGG